MRLFISIPITEHMVDKLVQNLNPARQALKGMNIRYQPPQKWHFTIVFLGEQPERDVEVIKRGLEEVAGSTEAPDILINNIQYGPPGNEPRMIWATTDKETSKRLGHLREKFRTKLTDLGIRWKQSKWRYRGHITLARFEPDHLKNPPEIRKDTHLTFEPPKIELKKSTLSPRGARYSTLHSAGFGKKN